MVDLKKILTDIASAMVDHPDQVTVTDSDENGDVLLSLSVAPEDMGKVIGKHGRIAKAIRTVMKAAATSVDRHVIVKIIE